MKIHLRSVILLLMSVIFLSGCWDIKVLNEMHYVLTVGLDYDAKNKEYVVYTQYVEFGSIAPGDGGSPEEIPPWIGIGRGETVKMAMQNLYDEAQEEIYWGHLSSVVLSENLLKQGIEDPIDAIIRHPESRYMPWIFGTKQPITDVLNITAMFNQSPLRTIIHSPLKTFRQKSKIKPLQMNQFLRWFKEPTYTVLLPNIEVSEEIFQKDEESKPLYRIDGALLIQDEGYKGSLSLEELTGYIWLQDDTVRFPVLLRMGKEPIMVAMVTTPESMIHHVVEGDQVKFNIDIHAQANLKDVKKTISPNEIEEQLKEIIEKDVRYTFRKGMELGTDVLHLRDEVYRNNVELWKSQIRKNGFQLNENSLETINVKVDVNHSGKYQLHDIEIYNKRFMDRIED